MYNFLSIHICVRVVVVVVVGLNGTVATEYMKKNKKD